MSYHERVDHWFLVVMFLLALVAAYCVADAAKSWYQTHLDPVFKIAQAQ